jgi:DNA-binding NtrC family response regulator
MVRPCFLVVDREFAGSISTRKLVIETAKFNVVTAYSAQEAVDTLRKFPGMTAAVIDAAVKDIPCDDLAQTLKEIQPNLRVVAISSPGAIRCKFADDEIDSFEPARLLELLRSYVPDAADRILKRNNELQKKEEES